MNFWPSVSWVFARPYQSNGDVGLADTSERNDIKTEVSKIDRSSLLVLAGLVVGLVMNKYVALAFHISIFLYIGYAERKKIAPLVRNARIVDLIVFSCLVTWLYGIAMGLSSGADPKQVFHNFFGMTYYSYYFLCALVAIPLRYLTWWIFLTASVAAIECFISVTTNYHKKNLEEYLTYGRFMRFYYSDKISAVIATIHFWLNNGELKFTARATPLFHLLIKLVGLITLLLVAFFAVSKGMTLGIIFVLLASLFLNLRQKFLVNAGFALLLAYLYFFSWQGHIIVQKMVSKEDSGNVVRYEQLEKMSKNISIGGNGLGTPIAQNYTRDGANNYAAELSYVNVIQKFGFTSIFVFLSYIYSFWICIKISISPDLGKYRGKIAFFGLMAFAFPAIGNPNLFAFSSVIMHSIFLYSIRPLSGKCSDLLTKLKIVK